MEAAKPEPKPSGRGEVILPLVLKDLQDRAVMGEGKYGVKLRANNGRNALKDAYDEACDLVMYLRQKIYEEENSAVTKIYNSWRENRKFKPYRSPVEKIIDKQMNPNPGDIIYWDGEQPIYGTIHIDTAYPLKKNETTKESILHEAHRLVTGDRGQAYGHPAKDLGRTAKMVSALLSDKLKEDLVAEDIAKIMIAVKLSRETNKPKRDNRSDMAGYALVLDMIVEEKEKNRK